MSTLPGVNAIYLVDTEWGFREGRLEEESAWVPVLFCAVNLGTGERVHFWGRDSAMRLWFEARTQDLFVAHYAIAEMKYLFRLGMPLPRLWFDTFVAWRLLTNRPKQGAPDSSPSVKAGLSEALHGLGMQRVAPSVKKSLQMKIARLEFDHNDSSDRQEICEYCYSDCDGTRALYLKLKDCVPSARMEHWAEFLIATAKMELRGIPFDVIQFRQILDQLPGIESDLMRAANRTCPVYTDGTFRKAVFLNWCRETGIDWPVKRSPTTGKLYQPLDSSTLKDMEMRHPFIAEIRQVEKTRKQVGRRNMVIDNGTGRHHFGTSVFRSVTARNQPRRFVFSGPKWLRFLIVPESPDHVLVYFDFTAQEFAIAAGLSGDPAMREVYLASDCHLAFAIRAGAAPPDATKQTHGHVRKLYKTTNLGVLFGQTDYGISARLGVSRPLARSMIDDHHKIFPVFWEWSERTVQGAFDRGSIVTPCGWRSNVPPLSQERTWMNWPMQSAGADIMRFTITYLDRQNVRILAPVHDGFLLSCKRNQLEDLRSAVEFACRTAIDHVLPDFPMRWDFTVYNTRFEDEDGQAMWSRLQTSLGKDVTSYVTGPEPQGVTSSLTPNV